MSRRGSTMAKLLFFHGICWEMLRFLQLAKFQKTTKVG